MSSTSTERKLLSLRQEFDQSFVRAAGGPQPSQLDFLAIVVAGDAYAVRLSDVRSLHADRKLVAAPSVLPELLGMCGFRSVLTPVYDLAQLLGYGAKRDARWLVVVEGAQPIAFAFEGFDAHLRVPLESVSAPDEASAGAVGGAVLNLGVTRPLLRLPSLVEAIAVRIKALRPSQER
jgi:chemotaxis signal transduction protein